MSQGNIVYVIDANILVHLANPDDTQHAITQNALRKLRGQGHTLRTLPQALFEFWAVATRPKEKNGLGLSISDAETILTFFIRSFWPIPDDPAVLSNWRHIVVKYNTIGEQAHDARYIASMQAHGLSHLLTFDSDFNRYAAEGIVVTDPVNVSAPTEN